MLFNIPLLIAPLFVYNAFAFGLMGARVGDPWSAPIFTVQMLSDARWTLTLGDLMIIAALILLFVEILKATRTGMGSIVDHILSTLLFVAYLIEFLLVRETATSVFFILMVISLIDVIAGYSVTIRGARRDMTFGPGPQG
ncbi:hypothetical protein SAMN04515647_0955 [Cohaesibacter sp. ES.047]|uniref:hypothetical protein n=1 Tax=Cohaesibacter sp. ES.047 TaxID=1798205 RepID=UPI000BB76A8F|nr:hypothetical protein [Cohaesibacter sp. ES.047]SNY90782.1 hypothetical protein SAMN04515647_0955 [Cohaesibacter sp. ES.047]